MKLKAALFYLFVLITPATMHAQSVHLFNYNFNSPADTTSYSCLYFSNPDGTGLAKLRFTDAASGALVIKELSADDYELQEPAAGEKGYKLVVPTKFKDQDSSKIPAPVFIFNQNTNTGFYEPLGISTSAAEPVMPVTTTFRYRTFQKPDTLSKELAAQYFPSNDPFILRYFASRTRGSDKILNTFEAGIKMHLVIAADTLNKSIGYAGKADITKISETFKQLSQKMGITDKNFRYQLFAGKNFERGPILKAVAALNPGPLDIVVFYYVGHGFRVDTIDTFPRIMSTNITSDSQTIVKNSIRIKEEVFDVIRNKNGRFNLIISDCCNSSIEQPKKKGPEPPKTRGDDTWELNYKNTRGLFLNTVRSSILITAAENGQQAICSRDLNSAYLSAAFVNSLKEYTSSAKQNATWKQLLEAAKAGTARYARMTCCSEPCCDKTCTTGGVLRCTQTSVYTIQYNNK